MVWANTLKSNTFGLTMLLVNLVGSQMGEMLK
jgi:hypothetical protein